MNNLETIVGNIKKKQEVVESENKVKELTDPHVLRTKIGHIRRAKEDLKDLYLEYREIIKDKAVFILVTGSQREKFATIASKQFNCFHLDAEILYKELVDKVPPRLYTNYKASAALLDHINARFEEHATDLGIVGYPPTSFISRETTITLKNKEDAVKIIKRALNKTTGAEVIAIDAIDRIATRAVKANFTGKTVPIILHTDDETLIGELVKDFKGHFTKDVFVISTGSDVSEKLKTVSLSVLKTVTKKSVEESLLKVKENLN